MAGRNSPDVYDFDKQLNEKNEMKKMEQELLRNPLFNNVQKNFNYSIVEYLKLRAKESNDSFEKNDIINRANISPELRDLLLDYLRFLYAYPNSIISKDVFTQDIEDDRSQLSALFSPKGGLIELIAGVGNYGKNLEGYTRVPDKIKETPREKQIRELKEKGIDPFDLSSINFSFDTGITYNINPKNNTREQIPNSYINYNTIGGFADGIYKLEDYTIINLGNNQYEVTLIFGKFGKTKWYNSQKPEKKKMKFEYYGPRSNSIRIIDDNHSFAINVEGNKMVINQIKGMHLELDFHNYHRHQRRR